ncbi:DUF551 domain-containing protein [Cohnella sp. GbtcB17]|uniref:DUF551 domain-containing protein n=1 Tax=Cohnella sp. GbtcB17 TaxID=2824762 RepID=UPI001C2FA30C|nr:DUF551 domain-containing protein [Cohnella sp. GbtcB17]
MTDTVNKQALNSAISMLSLLMNRGHINFKNYGCPTESEISELIARLSSTPSTPVQGYQEDNVVKRARERCRAGNIDDDYVMRLAREIEALRLTNSRLQRDAVMFMEALSQTDIQPSGWMPIESAPKDGSDILVLNNDGHVYEAAYEREEWRFAFADQHGCGCCGGDAEYPTHWIPLPQPPGINSTEQADIQPSGADKIAAAYKSHSPTHTYGNAYRQATRDTLRRLGITIPGINSTEDDQPGPSERMCDVLTVCYKCQNTMTVYDVPYRDRNKTYYCGECSTEEEETE